MKKRQIKNMVDREMKYLTENIKYNHSKSERGNVLTEEKGDDFNVIGEIYHSDEKGRRIVTMLNNHPHLVEEVAELRSRLLSIYRSIPWQKIQYDDPNRDRLLEYISNMAGDGLYGTGLEESE